MARFEQHQTNLHERSWIAPTRVVGILVFVILAILVQLRVLHGLDVAAAYAKQALTNGFVDHVGALCSIAFSVELSTVYAVVLSVYLWKSGRQGWALAPFAFVIPVALELILKIAIHQPLVPSQFFRDDSYPLATLSLPNSFPSGHAIRCGFFVTFLAFFVDWDNRTVSWIAGAGLILTAVLTGFTRVYLGDHWLSDVVAGLILGATTALFVAPEAASWLRSKNRPEATPIGQW